MIDKLTKKEFIEELKMSQGYYIGSGWMPMQEVEKLLKTIEYEWNEELAESTAIYKIRDLVVKSNRLLIYTENGNVNHRYFNGKNSYYKVNNFLVHISVENNNYDNVVVMVNL